MGGTPGVFDYFAGESPEPSPAPAHLRMLTAAPPCMRPAPLAVTGPLAHAQQQQQQHGIGQGRQQQEHSRQQQAHTGGRQQGRGRQQQQQQAQQQQQRHMPALPPPAPALGGSEDALGVFAFHDDLEGVDWGMAGSGPLSNPGSGRMSIPPPVSCGSLQSPDMILEPLGCCSVAFPLGCLAQPWPPQWG